MKKQTFVVEGANFWVKLSVDSETCGDPYMEACTRALEIVFKHNFKASDEALMKIADEEPNLGLIMQVYRVEDAKDDDKHSWVSSEIVAKNAGLPEIASQLHEARQKLKRDAEGDDAVEFS